MASIFDYLAAGLGDTASYEAKDPFVQAGKSLSSFQYKPQTSAEALWMPALQGLLSGGLYGYGQKQANETAYDVARANPLLQSYSQQVRDQNASFIGPPTEQGQIASLLSDYSGEDAPKGWSADIAKPQLIQALLTQQTAEEEKARKAELQKSLLPYSELAVQAAGAKKAAEMAAENQVTGNPKIKALEKDTYDRITSLPEYKQFADISPNFRSALELSKQDSKASDIGLISTIARIRDPNSTVREGEYAINSDTQNYLDTVAGNWRSVVKGKSRLTPGVKLEILNSVAPKYNETGKAYQQMKSQLVDALQSQGGDPSHIPTTDYVPWASETAPPPGMKLQRNKLTGETRLVPQ